MWVSPVWPPLISLGRQHGFAEEQRTRRGRYVLLAHEALTNQEGVNANRLETVAISIREDAAFAHQQAILWNHWGLSLIHI